ncbi:efflux RND transporter periplasmic adaptor subunit, partial [bacterium]|nr:efflux RND transporter periplasmic adaptor subunit [bacterium]
MNKIKYLFLCIFFYSAFIILTGNCQKSSNHNHDGHDNTEESHNHSKDDEHDHEDENDNHNNNDAIILDEKSEKLIGLETKKAVLTDIYETISVPGKIINNENNEVHINTLISGRINVLMANWGDKVSKGQELVCLESIELGKKRAEYSKAYAEYELASKNYERKKRLFEKDIISERQFLEAETKKISAGVNLEYARKMLRMTGLTDDEIEIPPDEHDVIEGCSVHLVSPIDGVIIERNVKKGEQVESGTCLLKVLDISNVWIEADVFEKDLHYVKKGGQIKLTVPAFPNEVYEGKILTVGSVLNKKTRTVKIRSGIVNRNEKLKPGMFANVDIIAGARNNVVAVPKAAVLSENNIN